MVGAATSFLHRMNGCGGFLHSCIRFYTASDTLFISLASRDCDGRPAGGIF